MNNSGRCYLLIIYRVFSKMMLGVLGYIIKCMYQIYFKIFNFGIIVKDRVICFLEFYFVDNNNSIIQ